MIQRTIVIHGLLSTGTLISVNFATVRSARIVTLVELAAFGFDLLLSAFVFFGQCMTVALE